MAEEVEVKFLNIDIDKLQEKLVDIEAEKVGEYFYRRRVFDYPDLRLDKEAAWVRLRDEGDKITLGFKQRTGVTSASGDDAGMEEYEVVVNDFDEMGRILEKIGLAEKFYMENKRIRWKKGDVEFDIDLWPELDPYLEIEASSWDNLNKAVLELGFDPDDQKIYSTTQIYEEAGIRDKDYQRITFEGLVKKDEQ